ncbi:MAG: helix-hairpin-helix domain-containing protein [Clostridiales bacterium]|nr:helix-hairpin-helix domain-containing protein [Clostridiales bacterium]
MKRKRKGIIPYLVLVVVVIIAGLYYYSISQQPNWEVIEETGTKTQEEELSEAASKPSVICVHVCGAVNKPGVYEGTEDLRLYQFIELAGGFREDALAEYLNLAQTVQDGMQIYVPSKQDMSQSAVSPMQSSGQQKLNLNTASKADLIQLPGIGDTKAQAILFYRDTNGAFQSIEQLMDVPGIKEATFEQIKNLITVVN